MNPRTGSITRSPSRQRATGTGAPRCVQPDRAGRDTPCAARALRSRDRPRAGARAGPRQSHQAPGHPRATPLPGRDSTMTTHAKNLPTKPGCIDTILGARASLALGRSLSAELAHHVERCVACQVERLAYDSLDDDRGPANPALAERIQRAARPGPAAPPANESRSRVPGATIARWHAMMPSCSSAGAPATGTPGEALFDRYYSAVERFFLNKVSADLGDLAQETFRKCWQARERVVDSSKFRAYLFSIAYNTLRSYFRAKQSQGQHIDFEAARRICPGTRAQLAPGAETRATPLARGAAAHPGGAASPSRAALTGKVSRRARWPRCSAAPAIRSRGSCSGPGKRWKPRWRRSPNRPSSCRPP